MALVRVWSVSVKGSASVRHLYFTDFVYNVYIMLLSVLLCRVSMYVCVCVCEAVKRRHRFVSFFFWENIKNAVALSLPYASLQITGKVNERVVPNE